MPRLRNKATGSVVSVPDEFAAALPRAEWVNLDEDPGPVVDDLDEESTEDPETAAEGPAKPAPRARKSKPFG